MNVSIRGDLSGFELSVRDLTDTVKARATFRALNKMADQVRTAVPRMVQDEGYGLSIGRIKRELTIVRASPGQLTASVRAKGRSIPLIEYQARTTSKGVTVKVKASRKLLAGRFIATMPNGHRGVYDRIGGKGHKITKNGKRYSTTLPISQEFGPSVPGIVVNKAIERLVIQAVADKFPELLRREVAFASR